MNDNKREIRPEVWVLAFRVWGLVGSCWSGCMVCAV